MRRREFITLLGAAALPHVAHAQRAAALPVIGFLSSASQGPTEYQVTAFRQGLKEAGYVEGHNVAIEFRFANGRYDQLPALASELIRKQIAVIVAVAPVSAVAAKNAAPNIPIVFVTGVDPVGLGLVASLNRPGGNLTGINFNIAELPGKILGMTLQVIPNVTIVGALLNPTEPSYVGQSKDFESAARDFGRQIYILKAASEGEIDLAFNQAKELRVGALVVGADPFIFSRRDQIVELARRLAIPTVYALREYVASGGLLSYGTNLRDAYRQVGVYTGRILKGDNVADLPVIQATRFELVINLKAAKALGLDIPPQLLAIADEVIE